MRKYVTSTNKTGYSKAMQATYNNRIKIYANQALEDLTLLAKTLPENQQSNIFNRKNLIPLFRAMLRQTPQEMTELVQNQDLAKQKRERLQPLTFEIINLLNNSNLSYIIAPVGARYMIKEGDSLAHLKAIYYRTLNGRDDRE